MTTTMNKSQSRKARLESHYQLCEKLGKITGSKLTGKKISTELFKLETLAHNGATAFNNGECFTACTTITRRESVCSHFDFNKNEDDWDLFKTLIEKKLAQILSSIPKGFFVNGDSRGYALKLEENSIDLPLHTDWGRYQILSPDLNND